ncbi:MAG: AAA family ATPase [Bacteroidales bacterium]|nr:AAA family ATPase [Bacteroidales bacterium]
MIKKQTVKAKGMVDVNMLRDRIVHLVEGMNKGAKEREEVIGLSLLAAMAGESIFLLGLPGVGKSMVARRLKDAFHSARSFEYLMSRFSTPDEIFGPVSISKLKDCDTYERVTDGYLPSSDIVFLDEIWKAGPAIQNALLTAINEKLFRNGGYDMSLPLIGLISASNELPSQGEGLEALWDRFIIRYIVNPIFGRSSFKELITSSGEDYSGIPEYCQITRQEWEEVRESSKSVSIPDYIVDIIANLRTKYIVRMNRRFYGDDKGADEYDKIPYVSDRRWKKIVGILKMSALLNGRTEVDLSDCLLMEHMIWDDDMEIEKVCSDVEQEVAKGVFASSARSMGKRPVTSQPAQEKDPFLLTPDGDYVIDAGSEKVLISKKDYGLISPDGSYARFEGKDRIVLCSQNETGSFPVGVPTLGAVSIRNFTYHLKKAPVETLKSRRDNFLNGVDSEVKSKILLFEEDLQNNLFTRGIDSYKTLEQYFRRYIPNGQ